MNAADHASNRTPSAPPAEANSPSHRPAHAAASAAPASRIFLGCSGWAYPSWKPEFYPAKTPAKKLLAHYATRLNSVEVNYTFRTLPSEALVQSWLAQVGDGFRFSFKAPQRITHMKRLKDCADVLAAFYASLLPAVRSGQMGLVLFQLPPNLPADAARLAAFLEDAAPSGLRLAFEFRNASWFADEVYAVLRQHNAALCMAESDELMTPHVETASFSCYRLRRSDYSPSELEQVRTMFLAAAERGEVYGYFKHEEAPAGPLRAEAVLKGLQEP